MRCLQVGGDMKIEGKAIFDKDAGKYRVSGCYLSTGDHIQIWCGEEAGGWIKTVVKYASDHYYTESGVLKDGCLVKF